MKNKKVIILFFVSISLVLLSGCSAKVVKHLAVKNLPPQEKDQQIFIYTDPTQIPKETTFIGTLFVGDNGSTSKSNCDSITIFELAKTEVRAAGGNAFLLTKYVKPSF